MTEFWNNGFRSSYGAWYSNQEWTKTQFYNSPKLQAQNLWWVLNLQFPLLDVLQHLQAWRLVGNVSVALWFMCAGFELQVKAIVLPTFFQGQLDTISLSSNWALVLIVWGWSLLFSIIKQIYSQPCKLIRIQLMECATSFAFTTGTHDVWLRNRGSKLCQISPLYVRKPWCAKISKHHEVNSFCKHCDEIAVGIGAFVFWEKARITRWDYQIGVKQ